MPDNVKQASILGLPGKSLIGMVHVGPLPGSPLHDGDLDAVVHRAVNDARALKETGFNALIVENMHDRPYVNAPHPPETVAAMTRIVLAVRDAIGDMPMGVQVLSRGECEALAIASICGGSFIRCENFVYAHIADEGLMADAAAGPLLRRRKALGAGHVRILADVRKKHASHAITSDLSIADAVRAAEFAMADAVIITGAFTGDAPAVEDLRDARAATSLPVLAGSGVTGQNVEALLDAADAVIVGSWIKQGGDWRNAVDPARCATLANLRGRLA